MSIACSQGTTKTAFYMAGAVEVFTLFTILTIQNNIINLQKNYESSYFGVAEKKKNSKNYLTLSRGFCKDTYKYTVCMVLYCSINVKYCEPPSFNVVLNANHLQLTCGKNVSISP